MNTVLVTGASGFVGRALCDRLEEQDFVVRRALRRLPDTRQGQAFAVGDLGPDTDWGKAVSGCDTVVHLAARVHVMGPPLSAEWETFHRTNVLGTDSLAWQAARAGVRRLVFLSSVKVNGEGSERRAFMESDPVRPLDAYGRSKAEAENRLKAVAAQTGMEIVIVRPPLVYGPGVRANFLALMRTVDAGVPLPFASIDNRRSLVYLGNLVHALQACVSHPAAAGRTFFVSDDHDVSSAQLIREIAAALGKKPRLLPFPSALLRGIGLLTGRSEQVARLTGSLYVDISAIKSTLGWQPPFTLLQGLAQTASWYRARSG